MTPAKSAHSENAIELDLERESPAAAAYRRRRCRHVGSPAPGAGPRRAHCGTKRSPNILVIMGDDVGWFNIGAYHRGIMSGKTPNLDKLAAEGMMFTDYYAEASCTAGRASFITGEIPLAHGPDDRGPGRRGRGHAGSGCTIATALKAQGYATGQFGKNHLGDLNKFLPTLHGFDEFFGYLYHLDAMSDPYWYSFPNDPAYRDKVGPRNMVHTWATDTDDATEQPRWGKVGKQKIVDEGPLAPYPDMSNVPNMHDITPKAKYDMGTFDEVLVKASSDFMDKAKKDGKPFFVWHNTTRMHVWTFLSPKYQAHDEQRDQLRSRGSRHGADGRQRRRPPEAPGGHGRGRQHHRRLHHRQRRRSVHLARWWHDPVQGHQGHGDGRRLPRAVHRPLAGQDQAGHGRERYLLRPRLVPDARGRCRQPRHHRPTPEGREAR